MINPETGNRIKMVTTEAGTGRELERRDLVKGYEFNKDRYLLLTDEDLDSIKVESSSVMTVEKFVETASIDRVYYDSSYFLAPDGQAGRDVYAVLREAIAKTGMTALSRVVISQRERTIALRPVEGGLMAHTLYEDRDLNSSKDLFDGLDDIKTDPAMVQLATQLVQRQAGKYESADLEDRYETRLRAMIDAKLKGEGIDLEAEEPVASTSNVIAIASGKTGSAEAQEDRGRATDRPEASDQGRQAGISRQARGSDGDQVFAQTGLSLLPFLPTLNANLAALLVHVDDAIDPGVGDEAASEGYCCLRQSPRRPPTIDRL